MLLYRGLKALAADKKASMSVQVVVFSMMLFGTSGIVMDFGRVYSEHSKMQAFTDQAALNAAAELSPAAGLNEDETTTDQPNRIDRAIAAVYGNGDGAPITKNAVFSEGDETEFKISHLYFLSDLSDDVGTQTQSLGSDLNENLVYAHFADGSGSGDKELAVSTARYVVAIAEERSVRNSLMRLINARGDEPVNETNAVRTSAAAKPRAVYTGAVSNLVMCNPFENEPDMTFDSFISDSSSTGFQFELEADGQMSSVDGSLTGLQSLALRTNLKSPDRVTNICTDPSVMPGAGDATVSTICIMAATTEPDRFLTPNEITITAASPEVITTALNTRFDMWDSPISEVLKWDNPADPREDLSILFQPDPNILKARVHNQALAQANAARGIPSSSRLNYSGVNTEDQYDTMMLPCIRNQGGIAADNSCYRNSNGELLSFVAEPVIRPGDYLLQEYYRGVFKELYRSTYTEPVVSDNIETFYEMYQRERDEFLNSETGFQTLFGTGAPYDTFLPGSSAVAFFPFEDSAIGIDPRHRNDLREDGSLSKYVGGEEQRSYRLVFNSDGTPKDELDFEGNIVTNDDGEVVGDGYQDIEPTSTNYTYTDDATDEIMTTFVDSAGVTQPFEPRVMDLTVVNCGQNRVNGEGETVAEVAGFAKMLMMQPTRPSCADGSENCLNSDLVSTKVRFELIGETEMEPETFAVLVR